MMKYENFQFPYHEKSPVRDEREKEKLAYNIRWMTMREEDAVFNPQFNWENYLSNRCSLHKNDIHNMKVAGYLSLDPDGRAEILDDRGYSMNPRDEDGRTLYFSDKFQAWELGRALYQHFKQKDFYCREFKSTRPNNRGIKEELLRSQKKAKETKRKPITKRTTKK